MAAESAAHDGLPNLRFDPAADPDAQATVNDFIDYTELFPSDMIRSLTLIRKLDEIAEEQIQKVHNLLKVYGSLPSMLPEDRPDSLELRAQISKALGRATSCRQAAAAEADRLHLNTERLCNRLTIIKTKLQALPKPPSRDPTPPPVSPQNTRSRRQEYQPTPRLTLHVDKARQTSQKPQKKKVLVPGEPLPSGPEDVYSAAEEDSGDDVFGRSMSADAGAADHSRRDRPGRKEKKTPKPSSLKIPKTPKVRSHGVMGTNVHSSVAGISTSNALAKLTPPPQDAQPGSRWRPWLKLTEYEMASLRKSMKKNAVWTPSDTMIRRELAKDGRGRENYEKAKEQAAAAGKEAFCHFHKIGRKLMLKLLGEQFLDEDPVDFSKATLAPGEVSWDQPNASETVNRGMKLNEAKKQKKEKEKEAARDGDQLEDVGRKMQLVGDQFKTLFSRDSPLAPSPLTTQARELPKSSRKRKRDSDKQSAATETSALSSSTQETQGPKKLKIAPPSAAKIAPKPAPKLAAKPASPTKTTTVTTTTQVPLAPAGPSSSPKSSTTSRRAATPAISPTDMKKGISTPTQPTAAQSRSRRTSVKPEPPAPTTPKDREFAIRPRSRGAVIEGKAASAEPPSRKGESRELRELRRASVVDMNPLVDFAAAPRVTRGGRRPAPGLVTADEDGKGKVSVGKRKAAPRRKGSVAAGGQKGAAEKQMVVEDPEWMDIDPDEPTYCLCNRVSFGTMIACENDEVGYSPPPFGVFLDIADMYSAIANGSTSSASGWRRFHRAEPSGIVPNAGRSWALMRRAMLLLLLLMRGLRDVNGVLERR